MGQRAGCRWKQKKNQDDVSHQTLYNVHSRELIDLITASICQINMSCLCTANKKYTDMKQINKLRRVVTYFIIYTV